MGLHHERYILNHQSGVGIVRVPQLCSREYQTQTRVNLVLINTTAYIEVLENGDQFSRSPPICGLPTVLILILFTIRIGVLSRGKLNS